MPLLFSLGQHRALQAVAAHLEDGEKLFSFLDDIYVVCPRPDRVLPVHGIISRELWRYSRIRVHNGKTHVWNMAGVRPEGCDILERLAQQDDLEARVWTGSHVPAVEQGILILGTPLGHDEYVRAQLELKSSEHDVLLSRIPSVADVQSAWALLLHCASARANYLLRVVRPDLVRQFAARHDESIWTCLCQILGVPSDECDITARHTATLPLALGGLGLRSAVRTSLPAHWASWGECLGMIKDRHPEVADMIVSALENHPRTPNLEAAHGFEPPDWRSLANGLRPSPREPEEHEPGCSRKGWQHGARKSQT